MMQKLQLDFVAEKRSSPWLGWLLLGIAAFIAVDTGVSYHAARSTAKQAEALLAQRLPAGRAPAKASPAEVAEVRESVQRLSMPWDSLFVALESAASENVTLSAIEPDTRSGTVTIQGDGKDYLAALTYVLNLSRTEGLERVQLLRHEQKANDPKGPVTFAVSAAWSTQ
jgi:Tfp pilus assembly protein PilN